jgi:AbrB family looped-hinge helix DNA binding protein
MNWKVPIDQAGRVVIPEHAREALGIGPGDELDITFDYIGITLRPVRHTVFLEKERGVRVFGTGVKLSEEDANGAVDFLRAQRTSAPE